MLGLNKFRPRLLHEYGLVLVVTVVFPLVGAGWHLSRRTEVLERRQALRRHLDLLNVAAEIIEHKHLDPWLASLRLADRLASEPSLTGYERQEVLDALLRQNPDLMEATIYDESGEVVARVVRPEMEVLNRHPVTGLPDLRAVRRGDRAMIARVMARRRVVLGPVVTSPDGSKGFLTVGVPCSLARAEAGVLCAKLALDGMEASIRRITEQDASDLYATDGSGRLVLRGKDAGGPLLQPMASAPPLAATAFSESVGPEQVEFQDEKGNAFVGAVAQIPRLGWKLIVVEPVDAAYFGFATLRRDVLSWVGLGLVLAGVAWVWNWMWFARPIRQIAMGAVRIAGGDFSIPIPLERRDEIGFLAQTLNRTAETIERHQLKNLNQIISEKSKSEAIVRSMADGLLVIDVDRRVAVLNSQFERWFGVAEINSRGKDYHDVIPHKGLQRHIDAALETGQQEAYTSSLELTVPGETSPRTLHVRTVRVVDNRREVVGIVTVLRDITREKKIEQMKSDLVSTVSHELRTPLTSIQGFSEILLEEDLSREEAMEFAQIINSEARRLGSLISDFLDLSRIESGEIEIKQESLRLNDVISSSRVVMEQQAAAKRISIYTEFPEDPHVYVIGDADKLEQVFVNLLSNAIKYSPPEKEVQLLVSASATTVTVKVVDHGFGIPPESLPRVFDRFYRVDMSATSETGGTGLGLTIVREIVERHGGRITVESEVGRGSVFTIVLPRFGARARTTAEAASS